MNVAFKLPPPMTVDEFIAWPGDGTATKYELVDGALRAQDPASDTHGTIHDNLAFAISGYLRATRPGCRLVIDPGVRPRVRANWNYRVPDLGVTCTPNRAGVHMTPDPVLLIEILSPSNEADTWSNIHLYASLPSLSEVLIVDSTKVAAEVLRRQADGSWPPDPEPISPAGVIRLDSIGLELPMAEVYRGTYLG